MALMLIDGPAVEPIPLGDAKLHLRLDTDDDDALIGGLITAARTHIEQILGRAMITQNWLQVLDDWPACRAPVRLGVAPVQSVTEVRVTDVDGGSAPLDAGSYFADYVSAPARLVPDGHTSWPTPGRRHSGIEIEFVAGYGDTPEDVPAPLRQAVLLLVTHWYEQRAPVDFATVAGGLPETVAGLLMPYRARRIA